MGVRNLFTDHPASVGESYFEHLCMAIGFAVRMILGGMACLLHAFFPFAFKRTGSDCISQLHDRMVLNRRRHPSAARSVRAGAAVR
jgi:hypothetical protein